MDIKRELETLKELKGFITDICFDYKDQPELGLLAIRILVRGKLSEAEFVGVWRKWREEKEGRR